jgi:murein DD-endopeptidase MepM/ murein hydrolase activator NlpD
MENKTYTILIASNRRGETRRITISSAWLKAGTFLAFVFAIVLSTGFVDYMGLLLTANENHKLVAENSALKKQFETVEEKVTSLEAGLERIQNFTKKLHMITNIDDEDRTLKLALSQIPKSGEAIAVTEGALTQNERQPSSEMPIAKDSLVSEKLPTDEDSGELATKRDALKDYASLSIRIDRAVKQSQLREQGLIQLWDTLSVRESLLNATPSIKPARGWYTSRFGYRVDPINGKAEMHAGIDIAAPPGSPVHAPADGIVSHVGYEPGYGKLVSIDHGYGVITRFAHNSRIFVEQGQKVHRWEVISAVGSTGRSTGAHVHYEVRIHGLPVDPMNYILEE